MQFLIVEKKFLCFSRRNISDLAGVATISDRKRDKVSDHSNLKILTTKQMF